MYFTKTIGYSDLLSLWKRGSRNGALRKLGSLKKGLFKCALEYCRRLGPITNPKLIGIIEGIADRINETIGKRIWRRGFELAHQWLSNRRMLSIFPGIKRWLCVDEYLFWLGTDALVKHRMWIMFQNNTQNQKP